MERSKIRVIAYAVVCATGCAPPGADRVVRIGIADPRTYWQDEAFVRLEPPVHVPSSDADSDQVQIWIRLPDGAVIETVAGPDGPTLALPSGTAIDRVEHAGRDASRRVVDVRGATIDDDGRISHHVLRRASSRGDSPLFGVRWPADDADAHAAATDLLLSELADTPELRAMARDRSKAVLASIRAKNDCGSCHEPLQSAVADVGERLVRRGTDAAGFYVPAAVLVDHAPLEGYGAHDPNLRDPFVTVRCEHGDVARSDASRVACPDRTPPIGRFDLRAARRAGDPRADDVCRARAYVFSHLDDAGKAIFGETMAACL